MPSHRRRARLRPIEHDAAGRPRCRFCQAPLGKGQRAFCGPLCKRDFGIRRSPTIAGIEFRKAYGAWCTGCGADEARVQALWEQCRALLADTPAADLLLPWDPFQLDHIRPVADGGGECGLENYRLLCRKCHAAVTKQWNLGRHARKTASGPWAASVRAKAGYKVAVREQRP